MRASNSSSGADLLLAVEGGGTHSRIALLDRRGGVVQAAESGDTNENFTSRGLARQAIAAGVEAVLERGGVEAGRVRQVVSAFLSPDLVRDVLLPRFPQAGFRRYGERDVVFARAGHYRPHGVGVVAATGATAWAVRQDDGRQAIFGGWGALLGDEGSAYAVGLLGLRAAARSFEGRESPTALLEATCRRFGCERASFREDLIRIAYGKPLRRPDVAGFAPQVTQLAKAGDEVAAGIVTKVVDDLVALALCAAHSLFAQDEVFVVAAAGGLLEAGEIVAGPLREGFERSFPRATMVIGTEEPAVALGRLALYDHSLHADAGSAVESRQPYAD